MRIPITIFKLGLYLKKVPALVGRDNGEVLRADLEVAGIVWKNLEQQFDEIEIVIPDYVVTINKSFFLGLFEESVLRLSKEGFIAKYKFNTTEHIKRKVEKHIDAIVEKCGN